MKMWVFFVLIIAFVLFLPPSSYAAVRDQEESPITILNPHEHPKQDDVWSVNFTTEGQHDLTISPDDQPTIDDLEFVSITCGTQYIEPIRLPNNTLSLQDWRCAEQATVNYRVLMAGNHTLAFAFNGVTERAHNSAYIWQWAKRLGGTEDDEGYFATTDSNRNIIVTGKIKDNVDVNGDGDSTDGGAEDATGYGLADLLLSVFDSSGTWQWAKRLGGVNADLGEGVIVDSNDNIIVIGRVSGNADVNGDGDSTDGGAESASGYGGDDILVTVFNSSGTWQWAKRLGGTATDRGFAVTVDTNDNIIITGRVNGNADVNGDGDSTDGGAESASGYAWDDIILSVFDSAGTWQWAKRLGGTVNDHGKAITTDSDDNIILGGYVKGDADVNGDGDRTDGGAESSAGYGNNDYLISVFDSAGTWQWAKRLGGANNDFVAGISSDTDNRVIVTGQINGNGDVNGDGDSTDGGAEDATGYAGNDTVISVFDSAGTWQWAKRLGGTGGEGGKSITTDSDNNIFALGTLDGNGDVNGDGDSTDGGAEDSTGYGGNDILFSVFDSSGTWQWAKRFGGTGNDGSKGSVTTNTDDDLIITGTFTGDGDVNGDGDLTDGGAEDAAGYGGNDVFITFFTFDSVAPTFSSVSATGTTSGATITWTSDEAASTQIEYGLTTSYGNTTIESDTSTRVTSHSDSITGLASCTTYHYRVKGADESSNTGTGNDGTFTTTGCTGEASTQAVSTTTTAVSTGGGGSLTHTESSVTKVALTIPASYNGTAANFQIHRLDSPSVTNTAPIRSNFVLVGSNTYALSALTDASTQITSFSSPITVTFNYLDTDISDISESSLLIHRWSGTAWLPLSGCSVNTSINTVTCTTSSFSTFALFGQASGSSTATSSTSSSQSSDKADRSDLNSADGGVIHRDNITTIIESGTLGFDMNLGVRVIDQALLTLPRNYTFRSPVYAVAYQNSDNSAVILPELQSKNSILAIHYTTESLGFDGSLFSLPQLKLAYSPDKIVWGILSTSVNDDVNKTVAALTKPDGYYAIVETGTSYSERVSTFSPTSSGGSTLGKTTIDGEGVSEDNYRGKLEGDSIKIDDSKGTRNDEQSLLQRIGSFFKNLFN